MPNNWTATWSLTCEWCESTFSAGQPTAKFCRSQCKSAMRRKLWRDKNPKPPPPPPKVCEVDGCERSDVKARGWCAMHYARWRKHRDVGGADRLKAPPGEGRFFNDDGYVLTWVPKAAGGYRIKRVHRLVMEQMLGRPLRDFENVHHINGIRDDNRPENLELWVKAQPSGQRAADLAEWVLDTYPELVEAARANRRQLRLIEGDIA